MKTSLVIAAALLLSACGDRGTRTELPPIDPVVTTVTEAPPAGQPTTTAPSALPAAEASTPPSPDTVGALDIDELDRVLDELERTMAELSDSFTINEGDIAP